MSLRPGQDDTFLPSRTLLAARIAILPLRRKIVIKRPFPLWPERHTLGTIPAYYYMQMALNKGV